jgi:hypothetical protein
MVSYEVEDVDDAWLSGFQGTSAVYHVLEQYQTGVIDTEIWDAEAVWNEIPVFLYEECQEGVSLAHDIADDLEPGLFTSLSNIGAFMEYYFGIIDGALKMMDRAKFFLPCNSHGYCGENLKYSNSLAPAVDATKKLMVHWRSSIVAKKLADGLVDSQADCKTKLENLSQKLKTAWEAMLTVYETGGAVGKSSYAELMLLSLSPLLDVYDPGTKALRMSLPEDSYIDDLAQIISDQRIPIVSVTVRTYPPTGSLSFKVDGLDYSQSRVFSWASGTSHTLQATSPQGEYLFDYWSDGGLSTHSVQPASNMEYVAFFSCPDGASFDAVADATVWSKEPTTNYGSDHMWVQANGDGRSLAMFRFNLTTIPKYAEVRSAELRLHCLKCFGGANLLALSRITGGAWSEDAVDWHHYPSYEYESIALADFGDIPVYSWDSDAYPKLRDVVQTWVKGPAVNYGFNLRGTGDGVWFYSREQSEPSRRPTLVVSYTASAAGSLTVCLDPSEIRDTAKWRLTSGPETNLQKSGATIGPIPVGQYGLQFSDVEGWITPPPQTAIIVVGGCQASATYTPYVRIPKVRTDAPADIKPWSVKLRGTVTDDGGAPCEGGFVYGRASLSVTAWRYEAAGSNYTTGDPFSKTISVSPDTDYGYLACAANTTGTGMGEPVWFRTPADNSNILEVRATADNGYALYTGDALGVSRLLGWRESISDYGAGIWDPETYTTELGDDPYLYAAAWSDSAVIQGLLIEVEVRRGSQSYQVSGGYSWVVTATGRGGNLYSPPSAAEINLEIGRADRGENPAGGWASPTWGPTNGDGTILPVVEGGPRTVPGIGDGTRWIWYDSGNDPGADAPFGGYDHGEYLIFRIPILEQ